MSWNSELSVAILLVTLAGCGSRPRPSSDSTGGSPAAASDSSSLVGAANMAYKAELAAMSAYARVACVECPQESPAFLAGSRHAFELAVKVDSSNAQALMGLANVLFSSAFDKLGDPIDSVLARAESLATRASRLARTPRERADADTLKSRIMSARK